MKWPRLLVWAVATVSVVFVSVLADATVYGYRNGTLATPQAGIRLTDANGGHLALFESSSGDGYGYWPVTHIPKRVVQTVLTLEDRRFYSHWGVDWIAVARAVLSNVTQRRTVSGASTLAMQLARMQNPRSRTLRHKLQEMAAAIFITARHGREAVLQAYMARVPYGHRLHGLGIAAQLYLGKPIEDLSWAEVAFLSAIPQAPAYSSPFDKHGRERARQRARRALAVMRTHEVFSDLAYRAALQQLAEVRPRERWRRKGDDVHASVTALKSLGAMTASADIRTSIDPRLQKLAARATADTVSQFSDRGAAQAASIVVRLQDLSVAAWVGSTGFEASVDGSRINFAEVKRSAGSTLKPFIYALALERGVLHPDTLLLDEPGPLRVANSDSRYLGPMLPRQALANSRNAPAVEVLERGGFHSTYWFLARLGLHDASRSPSHYGAGLALGALPVDLRRLVEAYGTLASDGVYRPIRWTRAQAVQGERILSRDTARLISAFLSDAQARMPTFKRLGPTDMGPDVALKTGTSQGHRDAWMVAWTDRFLVGAWVGRPDAKPMNRLSGGQTAGHLVHQVVAKLPGRKAPLKRPRRYQVQRLCAQTGEAANVSCPTVVDEWLKAAPRKAELRYAALDARTGRRALADTPGEFMTVRALRSRPHATVSTHERWSSGQEKVSILSPRRGLVLAVIPGLPTSKQSVAFKARVDAPDSERRLDWFVNGDFVGTTTNNEVLRWCPTRGSHKILVVARNNAASPASVTISVQ